MVIRWSFKADQSDNVVDVICDFLLWASFDFTNSHLIMLEFVAKHILGSVTWCICICSTFLNNICSDSCLVEDITMVKFIREPSLDGWCLMHLYCRWKRRAQSVKHWERFHSTREPSHKAPLHDPTVHAMVSSVL